MPPIFVDTNVFLRFLICDIPEQAERAKSLFERAVAGHLQLITTEMVLAELIWTLKSFYKLGNRDIRTFVEGILDTEGLSIINGDLVRVGLQHFVDRNIDFIDGYVAAVMQRHRVQTVFSFDKKHFDRIKGINRIEELPADVP